MKKVGQNDKDREVGGGGWEERGQLRAASCGQVSARTHREVQGWGGGGS